MTRTRTHIHTHTHTGGISHYQGNETEEKFFKDLNELTEVERWTETGSWFQITGAWQEKER